MGPSRWWNIEYQPVLKDRCYQATGRYRGNLNNAFLQEAVVLWINYRDLVPYTKPLSCLEFPGWRSIYCSMREQPWNGSACQESSQERGRFRAVWNSAASACSQHGCPTCVTVTNLRQYRTIGPSENLRMYGWCWELPGVTQIYGLILSSNSMLEYGLKKLLEACSTDATVQLTHGCSTSTREVQAQAAGGTVFHKI